MALNASEVLQIFERAILQRKVLKVTYQHAKPRKDIVARPRMAPFDRGTTNPNHLYFFCYDHRDKTGACQPQVRPILLDQIVEIVETTETFDEKITS